MMEPSTNPEVWWIQLRHLPSQPLREMKETVVMTPQSWEKEVSFRQSAAFIFQALSS